MSFLPRIRFGKDPKTEALERRVLTLQTALSQCAQMAGRWTEFRRSVTVAIAGFMLVLGFVLGTYREPIWHSVYDFAQAIGFPRQTPHSDVAYIAYQDGNYDAAKRLAAPLAAAGDARAQSLLGLIYYRGRGVAQDHNQALKWFLSAAEQGDIAAQFYLGVMFSEGDGVQQDYSAAVKWYRLAADRGDAAAQYNLGIAYATGEGGKPDNVSAYFWLNLAAARFPSSDTRRSAAAAGRDLVASKMTADQIAEAQNRAREWKPK
jgi:hypothetical protein